MPQRANHFGLGIKNISLRSEATRQSILSSRGAMDCFAEPVIRRRFAPTGWLAMTGFPDRTVWAATQKMAPTASPKNSFSHHDKLIPRNRTKNLP